MSGDWTVIRHEDNRDVTAQYATFDAAYSAVTEEDSEKRFDYMRRTSGLVTTEIQRNACGCVLVTRYLHPMTDICVASKAPGQITEITRGPIDWDAAGENVVRWGEERRFW